MLGGFAHYPVHRHRLLDSIRFMRERGHHQMMHKLRLDLVALRQNHFEKASHV